MGFIKYDELENNIEKEFSSKKKYVSKLSRIYKKLGFSDLSKRVGRCGDYLEFNYYDDNTCTLHNANFCFDPLCPVCNRRRALKLFNQVSSVVDVLKSQYDFIFLTLTVKNCDSNNLQKVFNDMNTAFTTRFLRYKKIKKVFEGCFKSFEVTVDNREYITNDMYYGNKSKHIKSRQKYYDKLNLRVGDKNPNFMMYHPHFHVVVAVPKNYLNSVDYINQDEICQLWQKAMKLNYKPVCDVRTVKNKNVNSNITNNKDFASAVAEVAKYSVKGSDYLSSQNDNINQEIVKTLHSVLYSHRLFSFFGIFADVRQALKYKDIQNDTNLVDVDENGVERVKQLTKILYYRYSHKDKKYYNFYTYNVNYAYLTSCRSDYVLDVV